MQRIFLRIGWALSILLLIVPASTVLKIWPKTYFWVERKNAKMPVWVRGNTASGTFVVFIHGGPGSCGTAESLFEVNPGNGRFGHASPMQALEADYAVVYWDQRHSGMSGGNADPNESRIEDFGEDLALVIREVRARYPIKHIFLIGQSWGHTVAASYLTLVDGWQGHQAQMDGYIDYKGNHESNAPYLASKSKITRFAEQEIAAGRDSAYWQAALQFHRQKSGLITPDDFIVHDNNAYRAMGLSIPLPSRIWAFFKASIFSPLNGWKVFFNNKKTMQAKKFWSRVTTDTSLSRTMERLAIPTLLIYGAKDLVAPSEIGQSIYDAIQTPPAQKTLLILPHSRHGAEGPDVPVMQKAIRDFIGRAITEVKAGG
ncbi:MAG: alpha/beta fold hydrolase [Desulfobacteraceae bacterium]|nr:MAG: alpha/beta fold hydrolase [Desulfobacteraceae bacterium]